MGNSPYSTLVLIALMVVAFYFLIIRPNKKRQQAQQATMNSLTPGTRVLLTSGVFGTLVEIGQKQAVIELSPGVHLTVLKQAIARAVRDGDEDGFDDADDDLADVDPLDESTTLDEPRPFGDADLSGSDSSHHDLGRPGPTGSAGSSTEASGSFSSDSYQRGNDDPRPGTSTSPIKD